MVPLEHRDSVEFGKVYNFSLKTIEEMPLNEIQRQILESSGNLQYRPLLYRLHRAANVPSANVADVADVRKQVAPRTTSTPEKWEGLDACFNVTIRLQRGRAPRHYFRIDRATFQRETGVVVEEGESYQIRGRIEGIGDFEKRLRSLAARQDIPFYAPSDVRSSIMVGAQYSVRIDSILKMAGRDDWHNRDETDYDDWTWRDIAAWVDTEGSIHANQTKGSRYLRIGQKEKKIIQQIWTFLKSHSIECSMFLDENTGVYYVSVDRTDHIALVIKNVEPFIRTENKKREIDAFRKFLAVPRKRLHAVILEARKILDVEEAS